MVQAPTFPNFRKKHMEKDEKVMACDLEFTTSTSLNPQLINWWQGAQPWSIEIYATDGCCSPNKWLVFCCGSNLGAEKMSDGLSENACKKKSKFRGDAGDVLLIWQMHGNLRSKVPFCVYLGLPYHSSPSIYKARPKFALNVLPSMVQPPELAFRATAMQSQWARAGLQHKVPLPTPK